MGKSINELQKVVGFPEGVIPIDLFAENTGFTPGEIRKIMRENGYILGKLNSVYVVDQEEFSNAIKNNIKNSQEKAEVKANNMAALATTRRRNAKAVKVLERSSISLDDLVYLTLNYNLVDRNKTFESFISEKVGVLRKYEIDTKRPLQLLDDVDPEEFMFTTNEGGVPSP